MQVFREEWRFGLKKNDISEKEKVGRPRMQIIEEKKSNSVVEFSLKRGPTTFSKIEAFLAEARYSSENALD